MGYFITHQMKRNAVSHYLKYPGLIRFHNSSDAHAEKHQMFYIAFSSYSTNLLSKYRLQGIISILRQHTFQKEYSNSPHWSKPFLDEKKFLEKDVAKRRIL